MTQDDEQRWRERGAEFGRLQATMADALRRLERTEIRLERLIWWIMVTAVGAAMGSASYVIRLIAEGI
ncbi:hypothetical protein [Cognatishimia sp. F0-27]|uniref:hypothetical protein n=1 Tax=Cognatishimia sp. F0-27 TaxID=2816855 RepID=UPI001D0C72FF|nr:hypothetical protein [Cognatishimia sp. F0-27]MCC1492725.1 hypothetical protein [Cognatishimia sp. F0-27]